MAFEEPLVNRSRRGNRDGPFAGGFRIPLLAACSTIAVVSMLAIGFVAMESAGLGRAAPPPAPCAPGSDASWELASGDYAMKPGGVCNSSAVHAALLAWPRTGSNLLATSLDTHPEFIWHGEVFHRDLCYISQKTRPLFLSLFDSRTEGGLAQTRRRAAPGEFLKEMWSRCAPATKVIGFKLFPGHLTETNVRSLVLADPGIVKIVLIRRDILAVCSSWAQAFNTGLWTSMHGAVKEPFRVEIDELLDCYGQYTSWYDFVAEGLRDAGETYIALHYEDLTGRYGETMEALYTKLGADTSFIVEPPLQKQRAGDLREWVKNYDELIEALAARNLSRYHSIG